MTAFSGVGYSVAANQAVVAQQKAAEQHYMSNMRTQLGAVVSTDQRQANLKDPEVVRGLGSAIHAMQSMYQDSQQGLGVSFANKLTAFDAWVSMS